MLILNTGAPQGCVLSPLLYSLLTHDCVNKHDSNTIIKFADDTTVVGLITDNDETAYREVVRELAVWCQDNNLSLNVSKTKELIVDYRKRRAEQAPINIDGAVVERVESFKFLGVHITNELSWSKHTKTVVKMARQHLFPPQETEKIWHGPPERQKVLQLHHREHPNRLHPHLVWQLPGSKALQRIVQMTKLPATQDLHNRLCQKKANKIVRDSSHRSYRLFSLLPHGKRYRSAKSRTKRLLNSLYPQAMRLLNNSYKSPPDNLH